MSLRRGIKGRGVERLSVPGEVCRGLRYQVEILVETLAVALPGLPDVPIPRRQACKPTAAGCTRRGLRAAGLCIHCRARNPPPGKPVAVGIQIAPVHSISIMK